MIRNLFERELRDEYARVCARHGVLLTHAKMTSATNPSTGGGRRSYRPARTLCGARTRAGGACLVRAEPGKARCRFHGGLSTSPKTKEGRERISEAQRRRWLEYRGKRGAHTVIGDDVGDPADQTESSSATPDGAGPVTP